MTKNKPAELSLKFTGKMSVLIEVEDYGPLQFRINDMELVKKVAEFIMEVTDNKTTVDSYNKREEKTLKKILDEIK